ncbi:extracellular solute-binding protein [Paeniglutamicibacter terrestris]|uniref:Extracellular solute-binding protein n=1 Tax=Paeniglutamicibacter terrestris TaxID=2723403 RepID=A0ABX1G985_9MICC|nr:extracellular solute-binding protein [Paeniglutamicibacter terrestris]ASN40112.1 sugar ABC transporter substrate-binding protein [Arthrobacter sp. 7749]NKG22828.1 extracellular solute-binding protein [Paeniglutamicibacter terrestris]
MKKLNLRGVAVAGVAAAALLLTSCGFGGASSTSSSEPGASGTVTTLTMLAPTYSDGTKALWTKVIKDFEAANPDVKVNLETQSWENVEGVLKTKIQGNKAPDIYNGGAFAEFAAEGLLAPTSDVASEATIADFQESFAENEKVDGTQYGLPLIASARALFYNKSLMEEAGVASVPTTWDELYSAAKAVSEKTKADGYGMPLGNEEAQGESLIWFAGNGGNFGDGSNIAVDTPANVEAAEFMKKMIDDGVTQKDAGATQRTPMLNTFIQGKLGFAYALPQTVGQIKKENPKLKYGIAPVPTKTGTPATLGVADRLMSFKNDGSKTAAVKKFMDYFFSADVYTNWVSTEGFLPTTKSGSEKLASDETLKPFLDMLPNAVFYPTTNAAWNATDGAFKSLMGQIATGKSAADVLKEIQAKADAAK